jgi:hypothetical protein
MWLFSKRQFRTRWLILIVGLRTIETFWKRFLKMEQQVLNNCLISKKSNICSTLYQFVLLKRHCSHISLMPDSFIIIYLIFVNFIKYNFCTNKSTMEQQDLNICLVLKKSRSRSAPYPIYLTSIFSLWTSIFSVFSR